MQTPLVLTMLLVFVIAAPASVHERADARLDLLISHPLEVGNNAESHQLEARQALCHVKYCTKLYRECVHSCTSLNNGDWYVLNFRGCQVTAR